jgi:hypothetical protein
MALAYQLSGMGISGPPRPSSNPMQMMPHGYAPAAAAPPMAVIGTDSKTIKIRGLPFRWACLLCVRFEAQGQRGTVEGALAAGCC